MARPGSDPNDDDLLTRVGAGVDALRGDRQVPFVCLGSSCPSTCCGPFQGTRALQALRESRELGPDFDGTMPNSSIFAEIRLTDEDVLRLQRAGLDRYIVRRGSIADTAYYLRLTEDGSCSALSPEKLCGIHPNRPTICRAFPFYIDLFAGLCIISACPGVGAGEQPLAELRSELEAALDMYRFWVERLAGE